MIDSEEPSRNLLAMVVPRWGALKPGGDPFAPYRLLDDAGGVVESVASFFAELQACGRSASTQRSYGLALLRWFRFLAVVEVAWDQATRVEARDFCRWIQIADKPVHPHWRRPEEAPSSRRQGWPNSVTGKVGPGVGYAPATVAQTETVVRGFYEFPLLAGSGPMVNPFPLARGRGRGNAHRNPMEPFRNEGSGLYRPRLVARAPRQIPDGGFEELFARLGSHRDRALVAFWVSTGARAAELLGATCADVDPGQQLITVVRKGSRALQQLPASCDAFVWLRLYQAQLQGLAPQAGDHPLWWTLRRPLRRLTYHAAHRMFTRAGAQLGANWTLHDLRHTAAYRMARDPGMPICDVRWVLGHAQLSTTQLYTSPLPEDVIASVLAHHERRAQQPPQAPVSARYRPESLNVLFGTDR